MMKSIRKTMNTHDISKHKWFQNNIFNAFGYMAANQIAMGRVI